MGFPRQEYWSGWLVSTRGDLPDPGNLPAFQVDFLPLCHLGNPILCKWTLNLCWRVRHRNSKCEPSLGSEGERRGGGEVVKED